MHHHAGVKHIVNYLDDFLGIDTSQRQALVGMKKCDDMGEETKIPYAPEKREGPATALIFLGIELDCRILQARLPHDKIVKAKKLIRAVLESKKARVKKLQSLHGYLNFCASFIPAGRAFLRSLAQLLHPSASNWVNIPDQVLLDLLTWLEFLTHFNGRAMFVKSGWVGDSVLSLETDSSGSWGCAAVFLDKYITVPWPQSVPRANLALLEFYPIVLATEVWAQEMSNKRLTIKCDNLATVFIINNLKAKDTVTMQLVRVFALQCLKHNIWFQAQHIPGVQNHGPDALSRGSFQRFHQMYPNKSPTLFRTPDHLLPENCLVP